MDKDRALGLLSEQLRVADEAETGGPDSPAFEQWHRDTEVAIRKIFPDKSDHHLRFINIGFTGHQLWTGEGTSDAQAFREGMQSSRSFLLSCITEIQRFWVAEPGNVADPEAWLGSCLQLLDRFHVVARQLRKRHEGRTTLEIADEYDVQDLLHGLLRVRFDDVRPEEWTPSYAGGHSRMDFLLKDQQAVVEAKMTRKGLTTREVGEQLIVDTKKYQKHPDCRNLICFVYDPDGFVSNPRGLESDLESERPIRVRVLVRPL